MGLPEIVDVARNYAVMVRIQGPDPKGLKMRKHAFHHYNSGKTTLSSSGMLLPGSFRFTPKSLQIGGDVDGRSLPGLALVVTVASIIEPFLSPQHRENISQAKPELIPGVQIDIMVEGRTEVEDEAKVSEKQAPCWLSAQLLTLVDVPASSIALQSLIESSSSSLEHGWEAGWSLASYSDGPQSFVDAIRTQVEQSSVHNKRHMLGGESNIPNLVNLSTTRIALLGVSSIIVKDRPKLNISPSNKRGHLLLAMGSPFGVLSPLHFFNSISVGSVANCYPSSSTTTSLLMADIRCLPGMEGGPVFGEQSQLIGVLTKPLRQKSSGAEIQLVIPWEAIATACSDLLQEEPQNAWKGIHYNSGKLNAVGNTSLSNSLGFYGFTNQFHGHCDSSFPLQSPVEKALASICLVTVDNGVWASGVLLNNQGLILTNAHLLEPWRFGKLPLSGVRYETKSEIFSLPSDQFARPEHEGVGAHQRSQGLMTGRLKTADSSVNDDRVQYKFSVTNKSHRSIRVRLDHMDPWIWCNARVLYVSKGPLDIALLQLDFVPDKLCPIVMDFRFPSPGSKAFVIGHGIFGPRCDFSPSASLGAVAKVVEAKMPSPQQSSTQENVGHFPAMLETTAAVHPGGSGGAVINSDGHMIGLVTSNAKHGGGAVIPHLNFSIPCAALEPIFKFSTDMQDLSLLEDLDKPNEHLASVWALVPPLFPKPGPFLPNLPESLPGDNNTEGKGSRFAKFIAERHEMLKRTAQLGNVERISSKFIPSKL
ncbi:glyoxysomal processing protease, glyoxysomal isoform X2 [Cornus florida]|uniref:glyoxysomal processing protease, glyoxysomal isoform X2 n=1 Tax=Cornus florida TaxID=4283 RepID=UPI002899ADAF|nr:glyoxysomal processing protease, glyoxysomal isoform X2 [Cornus florida]